MPRVGTPNVIITFFTVTIKFQTFDCSNDQKRFILENRRQSRKKKRSKQKSIFLPLQNTLKKYDNFCSQNIRNKDTNFYSAYTVYLLLKSKKKRNGKIL